MMARHAGLARELGAQLGLPNSMLDALAASYERWDGRGWPGLLAGDAIPVASRVAQLSEFVEVAHRGGGIDAAVALAERRRGTQFDPSMVDTLALDAEKVFGHLDDAGSWDTVINAEPSLAVELSRDEFDNALLAISRFVDLKSPFTIGHSEAVAELSRAAARHVGSSDDEALLMYRAGLVHDFGRLGVSNSIWDKQGPLGRRRLGTCPPLPVLHRANAATVGDARAARSDRRPTTRAAEWRRLSTPPRRQRHLDAGSHPRCSRCLPGDARTSRPPAGTISG